MAPARRIERLTTPLTAERSTGLSYAGMKNLVGVGGFESPASAAQEQRSTSELYPVGLASGISTQDLRFPKATD